MYTVSKGPSKLVAKARGGMSQNYEKYESNAKKLSDNSLSCGPKPVFQQTKKSYNHQTHHNGHVRGLNSGFLSNTNGADDEIISPQHDELVKYVRDSWNSLVQQDDNKTSVVSTKSNGSNHSNTSVTPSNMFYYNQPPSPVLSDFEPFDLESWWGRRIYKNITKNDLRTDQITKDCGL